MPLKGCVFGRVGEGLSTATLVGIEKRLDESCRRVYADWMPMSAWLGQHPQRSTALEYARRALDFFRPAAERLWGRLGEGLYWALV